MTFGPLPDELIRPAPASRGPIGSPDADVLALAGLMLDYPDDDLLARRPALLAASRALPAGGPAHALQRFVTWFAAADPDQVRLDYVATFDHRRRNALYVTFAAHGDMRRRGQALWAFQRLYADHGFDATPAELPDYLPTVLQFAALAPADARDQALAMARPGIELVARSLTASHSPWAPLLTAVQACLPALQPTLAHDIDAIIAAGPPTELVGAGFAESGATR